MILSSNVKSICWIVSWSLCFAVAMAFVKLIPLINTATIISLRFLIGCFIATPMVLFKGGLTALRTQHLFWHICNAVLRVLSIWSTYYAYSKLPMAFAASIGFTGPMITIVLAILILKEAVGWQKWFAVIVGYMGVLVMVQPESTELTSAIFIALFANLGSSLAKIITKEITKTDSTLLIMFYSNIIGLGLSAMLANVDFVMPSLHEFWILLTIGAVGSISQFSYLRALYHGSVSSVAPFEYIRLIFAVPIGLLFFNELPGLYGFIGSFIIIGSSAYLTYCELSRKSLGAINT